VTGDAGRLDQVLSNLVANALRHTARGGVITLRANAQPSGARIQVIDNGSGILPEDLPNIFDRFWRSDAFGASPAARRQGDAPGASLAAGRQGDAFGASPAVRRQDDHSRQEGTGLGLAIARQLVQAHGGVIRAESQPDQGTTFTIDLP
jgi:two-component system sensor histidine kinase BaeS